MKNDPCSVCSTDRTRKNKQNASAFLKKSRVLNFLCRNPLETFYGQRDWSRDERIIFIDHEIIPIFCSTVTECNAYR